MIAQLVALFAGWSILANMVGEPPPARGLRILAGIVALAGAVIWQLL